MSGKLSIAMLGYWCASHADGYAQTIAQGDKARIAAVWDSDPARGLPFARRLGVPFYADLDALFDAQEVDGVILNAEPWTHCDLAVRSARRGKHVLVDKIAAMGEEQRARLKDEIERAQQENGIVFATAFALIRRGYYVTARRIIQSGELGGIYGLRMREAHHQMARPGFPEALEKDVRGVFANTGFHTLYVMPYLMGEKPDSVTAVGLRAAGRPCEDNGVSVLTFPSGCIAVHETSYLSEQSPFTFGIYGDKGTLLMGGPDADMRVNTGGGWESIPVLPSLPMPEENWLDAIPTGKRPWFGLEEGLEKALWFDRLCQSMDEGRTVRL